VVLSLLKKGETGDSVATEQTRSDKNSDQIMGDSEQSGSTPNFGNLKWGCK
jgi:hypothetical protein